MSKSANEILFEHGIDTMSLNDDFNSRLLNAMERYAEQFKAQEHGYSLEDVRNMINMCLDQLSQPFEGRDDFINELVCHYSEKPKAQEQDNMLCALKIPINEQERTNVLLMGALRFLNEEQKIALRDALIERTPKAQEQKPIEKKVVWNAGDMVMWNLNEQPTQKPITDKEIEALAEDIPEELGWPNDGTAEPNDIKRAFIKGYKAGSGHE